MSRLERSFDRQKAIVVDNAESVLRLIEAGRSPDTIQAADMLGIPVEHLERELERQTLTEFVWSLAMRRRKKRRR
jgi:hypothetical protein